MFKVPGTNDPWAEGRPAPLEKPVKGVDETFVKAFLNLNLKAEKYLVKQNQSKCNFGQITRQPP